MKNTFSIKTKLFCGIIVPVFILIVVSYLDFVHLSALGQAAETILSHNYKSIQAAHRIRHLLGVRENALLARVLEAGGPEKPLFPSDSRISDLLLVIKNNITEEGENQIARRLLAIYPRYREHYGALAAAVGKTGRWPRRLSTELLILHAELNAYLDELISINEKAMEKAEGETKKIALRARKYSMALLGLAVIFSLVFSYFFAEKISRPLVNLSQSLSGIGRDLPEYPRLTVTGRDEIGFLNLGVQPSVRKTQGLRPNEPGQVDRGKKKSHPGGKSQGPLYRGSLPSAKNAHDLPVHEHRLPDGKNT